MQPWLQPRTQPRLQPQSRSTVDRALELIAWTGLPGLDCLDWLAELVAGTGR